MHIFDRPFEVTVSFEDTLGIRQVHRYYLTSTFFHNGLPRSRSRSPRGRSRSRSPRGRSRSRSPRGKSRSRSPRGKSRSRSPRRSRSRVRDRLEFAKLNLNLIFSFSLALNTLCVTVEAVEKLASIILARIYSTSSSCSFRVGLPTAAKHTSSV